MTCIPIPCTMHGANACHKATCNAQTHKHTKKHKNKRNVTKNAKIFKARIEQWRSKKPWQQNETNIRDPLKE
jgi:hypothetical protein